MKCKDRGLYDEAKAIAETVLSQHEDNYGELKPTIRTVIKEMIIEGIIFYRGNHIVWDL